MVSLEQQQQQQNVTNRVCVYINFRLSSKYVPNRTLAINLVEYIDDFNKWIHRFFII